jgi:hypothetical protein
VKLLIPRDKWAPELSVLVSDLVEILKLFIRRQKMLDRQVKMGQKHFCWYHCQCKLHANYNYLFIGNIKKYRVKYGGQLPSDISTFKSENVYMNLEHCVIE